MTTAQKIIKYLAIAFAIFIIVTIVSAILSSVYVLVSTLEIRKSNTTEGVGTIKIGEEEIKDDQTWGTGENYIKLDGAIGNIKVDFKDTL